MPGVLPDPALGGVVESTDVLSQGAEEAEAAGAATPNKVSLTPQVFLVSPIVVRAGHQDATHLWTTRDGCNLRA